MSQRFTSARARRRTTGAKIKALEKPANEAYISTLIERVFRDNAEIRFRRASD